MHKLLPTLLILLITLARCGDSSGLRAQQKVIPLYSGAAPGSENWTWSETESDKNIYHSNAIFNISKPTLTVYLPDSSHVPTGMAVIVCPGGGFHSLSIMQEGYGVVKWLQSKGITAFLLKYRLMHIQGSDPYQQENEDRTRKAADTERAQVADMAIADGRQALAYVRNHAADYGIDPKRIGIIGFSAGGVISVATAYNATPENRPDFIGFVYGGMTPATFQAAVPADAPPLFIAAASDDQYDLQLVAVKVYTKWVTAKRVAEMHIYARGGHGFGLRKQNLPTDSWTDRFLDFLTQQGLLKN